MLPKHLPRLCLLCVWCRAVGGRYQRVQRDETKQIANKMSGDVQFAQRALSVFLANVGWGHHIREVCDMPRYKRQPHRHHHHTGTWDGTICCGPHCLGLLFDLGMTKKRNRMGQRTDRTSAKWVPIGTATSRIQYPSKNHSSGTASLGARMKFSFVHKPRFMKNERILLLSRYPWAISVHNLGGWVNTFEVSFFLWGRGVL